MFKVQIKRPDGSEDRIAISKSYRLAKRIARIKASRDLGAFMGTFFLYEDKKLIEQGQIINTRISWEEIDAEETLQNSTSSDTNPA